MVDDSALDAQIIASFLEEVGDQLAELEQGLLELEVAPDDSELINRVFRALHTIKGLGRMFGYIHFSDFAHKLENVMDKVRSGKAEATHDVIGHLLTSRDRLKQMLSDQNDTDPALLEENDQLIDQLMVLCSLQGHDVPEPTQQLSEPAQEEEDDGAPAEEEAVPEALRVYRIRLVPGEKAFTNGFEIISILDELAMLGTLQVVAHCEEVKPLSEMEPTACMIGWDIIVTTDRAQNDIDDVFVFLDPDAELKIELVDDESFDTEEGYLKLGDILVERGDLSTTKMNEVLEDQSKQEIKRFGEVLADSGAVSSERIESALVEQQAVRKNRTAAKSKKSIRVDGSRLDRLVDMAGELVIIQARLNQLSAKVGNPEVEIISEELERLSAELRDATLGIRMSPIGSTFGKYRRMLRDLAAELGKNVDLTTEGAETELDKTVIELLSEPLLHIIRNGLDHGIESPEVRRAAGKPVRGMMKLVASHVGGEVLIKVHDDGAGLDAEKIYKKALEKGLITEEDELSEEEIFQLLLQPGFSTAAEVSELSGRGVGLDIVNRKIEELGGSVRIDGVLGQGTTTTILLPLTLAIIEGLMIKSGEELYVLPLRIVEECVELTSEQDQKSHGHKLVNVRGDMVPYMRLREWFGIDSKAPGTELAVIIEIEGVRFGFVVDSIIGQLQVVIKKLSAVYKGVKGLAGATILGDGSVALILDARALIQGASIAQKIKFTR